MFRIFQKKNNNSLVELLKDKTNAYYGIMPTTNIEEGELLIKLGATKSKNYITPDQLVFLKTREKLGVNYIPSEVISSLDISEFSFVNLQDFNGILPLKSLKNISNQEDVLYYSYELANKSNFKKSTHFSISSIKKYLTENDMSEDIKYLENGETVHVKNENGKCHYKIMRGGHILTHKKIGSFKNFKKSVDKGEESVFFKNSTDGYLISETW